MTKKQIKKIASASYTKNNLDQNKVKKVTALFTRRELKLYIQALKNLENNKTITLITPKISGNGNLVKELQKSFPDKKVLLREDNSLIAGVRIINKDDVYDFNIKNTLENLVSYIGN